MPVGYIQFHISWIFLFPTNTKTTVIDHPPAAMTPPTEQVRCGHLSGRFSYPGVMEAAYGKTGYYLLSLLQFMYPFLGKFGPARRALFLVVSLEESSKTKNFSVRALHTTSSSQRRSLHVLMNHSDTCGRWFSLIYTHDPIFTASRNTSCRISSSRLPGKGIVLVGLREKKTYDYIQHKFCCIFRVSLPTKASGTSRYGGKLEF